jgi:hypothetical protein
MFLKISKTPEESAVGSGVGEVTLNIALYSAFIFKKVTRFSNFDAP